MGLIKSLFNTSKDLLNLPLDITKDVLTFVEDERTKDRLEKLKDDLMDFEI